MRHQPSCKEDAILRLTTNILVHEMEFSPFHVPDTHLWMNLVYSWEYHLVRERTAIQKVKSSFESYSLLDRPFFPPESMTKTSQDCSYLPAHYQIENMGILVRSSQVYANIFSQGH